MANRQTTPLVEPKWITQPWQCFAKTSRDRLYDIAVELTEALSQLKKLHHNPKPKAQVLAESLLVFDGRLGLWHSLWLMGEHPNKISSCVCPPQSLLSCICSLSDALPPLSEFTLLQMEYLSLQLVLSVRLGEVQVTISPQDTAQFAELALRSPQIFLHMEELSTGLPLAHLHAQSSGITEAVCRNILPTWARREYCDHRTKTQTQFFV